MKRAIIVTGLTLACLQGCASRPEAPDSLRPPAGEELALELFASGVQVYECGAGAQPGAYEWKFKGPEASLRDPGGRPMGTHFAGPTWKAPDGSTVVGEVRGRAPSKEAGAIPLLLLAAKSGGEGAGMFTRVRSIQRLDTVGGQAPSAGCTALDLARVARVPYSATYYFYVER